jgi:Fe-S-cluster containining protein
LREHQQFDRFIDQWLADYRALGKTIYCRAGCAGCCLLAVHATFAEAVAIAGQLSQQQGTQLSAYISRLKQTLASNADLKSYLKSHRESIGPCPFLDQQKNCSIYPVRPLACRALLSTRPAGWCTVDFSELDKWDKLTYESSLDRQVVTWPTHFVAATQDFGRELEDRLLEAMRQEQGWSLSGNLSAMVWLEQEYQLSRQGTVTTRQLGDILAAEGFDHEFLLRISAEPHAGSIMEGENV